MKCPACADTLSEAKFGEIVLDICKNGCGGIWFDDREIKKFDEQHEFSGEPLLQLGKKQGVKLESAKVRFCPRCVREQLCRRWYDIKKQVEVDQCLRCSGIWLDTGELSSIRAQYQTEAERQKAADEFIEPFLDSTREILKETGDQELAAARAQVANANAVAQALMGFSGLFKRLLASP